MAVFEADCTTIEYEEGTLGGKTFYVTHPKWKNKEKAICFRPVKNVPIPENRHRHGALCERAAGWRTDHEGEGACRTHGGMNGRNNGAITHGKRANKTVQQMRRRIEDFVANDRDALLDLTFELGVLKVLLSDLIDMFPSTADDDYTIYVNRTVTMIQAAGSLVDKISRIDSRNTITANQILYLRATVADMLVKWIPDPEEQERAIKELITRMPGGPTESLMEGASNQIVLHES